MSEVLRTLLRLVGASLIASAGGGMIAALGLLLISLVSNPQRWFGNGIDFGMMDVVTVPFLLVAFVLAAIMAGVVAGIALGFLPWIVAGSMAWTMRRLEPLRYRLAWAALGCGVAVVVPLVGWWRLLPAAAGVPSGWMVAGLLIGGPASGYIYLKALAALGDGWAEEALQRSPRGWELLGPGPERPKPS